MQWTQEQQPIIHSTADKLLVQAFAGTGKTHTSPCVPPPEKSPSNGGSCEWSQWVDCSHLRQAAIGQKRTSSIYKSRCYSLSPLRRLPGRRHMPRPTLSPLRS